MSVESRFLPLMMYWPMKECQSMCLSRLLIRYLIRRLFSSIRQALQVRFVECANRSRLTCLGDPKPISWNTTFISVFDSGNRVSQDQGSCTIKACFSHVSKSPLEIADECCGVWPIKCRQASKTNK
jgi:hypothetical protein